MSGEKKLKINGERIFVNIICNVVIMLVITSVLLVGFSGGIINVFTNDANAPIYRGNTKTKNVTLMINVYGGAQYVEQMLALFEKYNVKTTFFVGGLWVEKNPETFARLAASGHEIGNHGYFHKEQSKLNYSQNYTEIKVCGEMVKSVSGIEMTLFAPPGGAFSQNTLKAAADLNYKTIMWSRDTIDWRDRDSSLIFTRATNKISGGELILMHPTAETVAALDKILKYYLTNGFTVVPVSQNISI